MHGQERQLSDHANRRRSELDRRLEMGEIQEWLYRFLLGGLESWMEHSSTVRENDGGNDERD